jgi:hypothetical protein
MALFGVLRLRALEMYLTPPTLSERRYFTNHVNAGDNTRYNFTSLWAISRLSQPSTGF